MFRYNTPESSVLFAELRDTRGRRSTTEEMNSSFPSEITQRIVTVSIQSLSNELAPSLAPPRRTPASPSQRKLTTQIIRTAARSYDSLLRNTSTDSRHSTAAPPRASPPYSQALPAGRTTPTPPPRGSPRGRPLPSAC